MYTHIDTYSKTHTYIYIYIHILTYTLLSLSASIYIYICIYVCVYNMCIYLNLSCYRLSKVRIVIYLYTYIYISMCVYVSKLTSNIFETTTTEANPKSRFRCRVCTHTSLAPTGSKPQLTRESRFKSASGGAGLFWWAPLKKHISISISILRKVPTHSFEVRALRLY